MPKKPVKKLGQNFLTDQNVRLKLLNLCAFKPSDTIIEIGPGKGELTGLIAAKAQRVIAIELDKELFLDLEKQFRARSNIILINADILKIDISKIASQTGNKVKLFGNIPYYISSPILERIIAQRAFIAEALLTLQKEFAKRLTAAPASKAYGALSCFAQYYADIQVLTGISRNSFFPKPKVDSSFIRFKLRRTPLVACSNEKLMFKIIRTAFNQRRKTLRSSLKDLVKKDPLDEFLKARSLSENSRPENLALQDFADLALLIGKYRKKI